MKTLEIELPDAWAARMEELVEAGGFGSEAEIVRLALADYLRRRPFELQATGAEGQEEGDALLRRDLDEEISLAKLAERLGVSRFEIQESFERLGVPVRLGLATLEDARDEVKVARDLK